MTECTINSYGYKTWSSAVSELSVLESIESTTQKAVFNYDLSKLDGAENMLPVLKSIQLFSKQGGKEYLTGKYDFVYDYSLASGALENDISSTSKKGRLTLKKLLSYGTGSEYLTYEFEYGYNPSWVESNHDRWGYYFDNSDSSNKYNHKDLPTGLRPEAWSLSKIYWPEGKTTEFVYEPDRYQYVQDSYFDEASYSGGKIVAKDTHYGGGLRVKLVTECNGMDECINTRYMYNKRGLDFNEEDGIGKSSEGESSGVATSVPGPYQKKIADEDENLMASAYGGAEVNYRTVTEVPFTDEEGMTKPYGYVLYTFTTAYQQPDTGSERETNNNNKRGMLEKVEYYSSTNKLLGSEENQYEIKSLNHKSLNFLDSVTTKVVQTKSIMDGLTKLQNIEYTENGLPRKTNTTNTNGQTLITTNQYAYEIYPEMKTKHMLGQVYETRMYENKESDSNVLSISRNIWAQFKGNWYPSLTELWVDDKTQFVGESQKMKKSKPGPNRIVSKIISYDDYGNVLESVDAKGNPTYFFYGDNNNPCSNDEKYNSFGHSVLTCTKNVLGHEAKTYLNNLYLVETVVSPNGETTQTEYDSFNRAKKVAGPGSTLSKPDITYEYHFFESKKNPNWVKTITKIDEKQSAVSITFTDGLGRTIQSQTQQSGNNWLVSKIDYYPETSLVSKTWKTKLASTKGQFDSSPGGGVYSSSLFENNPLMRIKEILPAISDKSKGAR
ncbi:MAG: hypothetical protein KKF89_01640 [Nanoarchaeota archaeon]|nr:hypothetical protein [Nanoarchaeota archaeon]MBU1854399.1 hypothetical protein [Nanoarchaeota archaeon]